MRMLEKVKAKPLRAWGPFLWKLEMYHSGGNVLLTYMPLAEVLHLSTCAYKSPTSGLAPRYTSVVPSRPTKPGLFTLAEESGSISFESDSCAI